ncbi:MAG: recombinase family protein, partial [Crocinitomicaceae bacterium]
MLGIYCRKSVANEEGKDRSINDQREKGKELSKSLGIDYEVYIDDGVSGTLPINKRPEFSRLIDNVNEGIITKVFVVDQSRLERSPEVRFTLNKIFEENNVELYTEGGKVGNDAESRAMGNIFSVINELYVELTKRKIKSVLKRNAQEGRAFSVNPYGYETDDKGMLTICKNEVEVVKKIYALSLKGIGTDKIAEILTKEGVPTRLKRAE